MDITKKVAGVIKIAKKDPSQSCKKFRSFLDFAKYANKKGRTKFHHKYPRKFRKFESYASSEVIWVMFELFVLVPKIINKNRNRFGHYECHRTGHYISHEIELYSSDSYNLDIKSISLRISKKSANGKKVDQKF